MDPQARAPGGRRADEHHRSDRDRRRGDVNRSGQNDGAEAEAEGGKTDDQTEGGVCGEVDRATEQHMPAASCQAAESEFEAEEEEQEDDPDLRDKRGHVRGADQAQRLRLIRAEQQPGEQIRRDRGQTDTRSDQPEAAEQRDRDCKLCERHRAFIGGAARTYRARRPAAVLAGY